MSSAGGYQGVTCDSFWGEPRQRLLILDTNFATRRRLAALPCLCLRLLQERISHMVWWVRWYQSSGWPSFSPSSSPLPQPSPVHTTQQHRDCLQSATHRTYSARLCFSIFTLVPPIFWQCASSRRSAHTAIARAQHFREKGHHCQRSNLRSSLSVSTLLR